MLHGCTQGPDDFALGTGMNDVAEEHDLIVAYPAQSQADNASLCWNWFELKDQKRGSGEPAVIAGLTKDLIAEFAIDPRRVFVAGLSAGGAMAAIMGATYPDLFSVVGIHSGLVSGSAGDLMSALAAMRGDYSPVSNNASGKSVRTIVFHGDADTTVHPSNAARIVTAAMPPSASRHSLRGRSAGGSDYIRTVVKDGADIPVVEYWAVQGMGHAWSGGNPAGSYTDPRGPDASREMVRFFLEHDRPD